jgi:SAM-dependent methyltransferase
MPRLTQSPFDAIPEVYDRVRPEYPAAMYDDLFAQIKLAPPVVLEIGPGTGQATVGLLARSGKGTVTALELGPNIAAFLRKKFEHEDRLTVVNEAFETATLPPAIFDLVASATAFHWLDPEIRLPKIHAALKPGGLIAVIQTTQIASHLDRGYFERSHPIYKRFGQATEYEPAPAEDFVPHTVRELTESPLYDDVRLFRYRWDQTYLTADYRDLLTSYSVTQWMEPAVREQALDALCDLIEAEFDGYVVRPLQVTMVTARRAAG